MTTLRRFSKHAYVLIGYPKDTLALAEQRLRQILALGFTPMACSGAPKRRRKKNGAQTNTGAPSSAGGLAPPSYTPV
jgi:hypothetical protein